MTSVMPEKLDLTWLTAAKKYLAEIHSAKLHQEA